MDPLSALIGGGASIIGGLMNTSSTQSINAANLQAQMWNAQGGYLPGLVANANKAGLNPLAVLGSRGPNMAVQVGTQPGAGLQEAGRDISKMSIEGFRKDLELKDAERDRQVALTKNTEIQSAIQQKTLDDLMANKTVSGAEPKVGTEWPATVMKGASDFMDWAQSQYYRIPSWVRRPQDVDWRQQMPDFAP